MNKLNSAIICLSILWFFLILFSSFYSFNNFETVQLYSDKLFHFFEYLVFSILFSLSFRIIFKPVPLKFNFIFTIFLLFLFGYIIELIQENFVAMRYFDWFDILSNILGIFFGILILIFLKISHFCKKFI